MLKTLDIPMSFGTYLDSANPNTALAASPYIHVRYTASSTYNVILKPAYSAAIPDFAIESASLYVYPAYISGSPSVTLKRVLQAATNGATWNKYDGTSDWETAGATGATDVSAALACSPISGFVQYQYKAINLTRAEYLAAKTDDQALLLTTTLLGSWMYFVNVGQPTNTPFIRVQYRSNSVPTFF